MRTIGRRVGVQVVSVVLICLSVSLGAWVTEAAKPDKDRWTLDCETRHCETRDCETRHCETKDCETCPPCCEPQDRETQGSVTPDREPVVHEPVVHEPVAPEIAASVIVEPPGDIPEVKEVVLNSQIETLAVLGQLTVCGDPIPESIFFLYVGLAHPSCTNWASVTSVQLYDATGRGIKADGVQITYIIPGNGIVSFMISRDQFVIGKEYWLPHLPDDPPGAASIAFF